MNFCRTFSVFVVAAALPLSAAAATHHPHHVHHRHHRAHHAPASVAPEKSAAPQEQAVAQVDPDRTGDAEPADVAESPAPGSIGSDLNAAKVAESKTHARRRLRGAKAADSADAALFNPPALIRNIPPAMKGTYASLVHQNRMASEEHIGRIADDEDLARMRKVGLLVPIPVTAILRVNESLPANRRYTRPWTAKFLSDISRAHYQRYHTYLQVNSAVRTVAFQRALLRVNGNAAPAEGDIASPHLTGQTVDIAKHELSAQEIAWMRLYLAPLVKAGKIDVAEEFQQACFHISVYKSYSSALKTGRPGLATPRARAGHHSQRRYVVPEEPRRGNSTALLAASMR